MMRTLADPTRLARTFALLIPGWLTDRFNRLAAVRGLHPIPPPMPHMPPIPPHPPQPGWADAGAMASDMVMAAAAQAIASREVNRVMSKSPFYVLLVLHTVAVTSLLIAAVALR